MSRKTLLFLIVALGLIIAVILVLFHSQQKGTLYSPSANKQDILIKVLPSETLIEYSDPSGFTFSYPDNLSLDKKDTDDPSAYADLLLSAKGVNGSLSLKISDSKFKTIDEWVKMNQTTLKETPKEVKLANLPALEIKLNDRILTGALDQGVLFAIEMPAVEEEFWMKVYHKILTTFSFATPAAESVGASDDVIFEGEEVIE